MFGILSDDEDDRYFRRLHDLEKMSYFKMDGSTTIQDRRFMVEEY